MRALIRLIIYTVLLFPIGYLMGGTYLSRRMKAYEGICVLLGSFVLLLILHLLLKRVWLRYRRFCERKHPTLELLGRAARAALFIAILFLPVKVMVPIGAGLSPIGFSLLTIAIVAVLVVQRKYRDRYPAWAKLDVPLILIIYCYAFMVVFAIHYLGSLNSTCDKVNASEFLVPIVTRHDIENSSVVEKSYPYGVKSDPDAGLLFYTLKQKRAGFIKVPGPLKKANDAICATSLENPGFDESMVIPIIGKSTATYAQRITVNPERKELYVVVLDIDGDHSVKTVSYDGDFRITHSFYPGFEPIRVYYNNDTNEMIVLGVEGHVGVFDLDTYKRRLVKRLDGVGFLGMIDTFVPNRDGTAYYAGVVSPYFLLVDAHSFDTIMRKKLNEPTIGLDYDPETNQVYAAATLTRSILVLDGDTLDVKKRIWTGTTVRELYIDRKRKLIVAAGYTDGHISFYDLKTLKLRGRIFIGKLARTIHIEQRSGRIFATSSCGLYEILVDRLLDQQGSG
ncbi:MAG TPA: WD40 repeat domain-containing protein [Proteobacteria bacterium]|nr:WD40 repeat domain-containing protein [Pseudomonadota bacterium]